MAGGREITPAIQLNIVPLTFIIAIMKKKERYFGPKAVVVIKRMNPIKDMPSGYRQNQYREL